MIELPIACTFTDADSIGSTVVNARGGQFFDPAPRRTLQVRLNLPLLRQARGTA